MVTVLVARPTPAMVGHSEVKAARDRIGPRKSASVLESAWPMISVFAKSSPAPRSDISLGKAADIRLLSGSIVGTTETG